MTAITAAQLKKIVGGSPDPSNMKSVLVALERYGEGAGLLKPHRLAHFIAQIAHESGGFRFDREIWGPTPAQKRYDQRVDLGNTPELDGDGKKNAGRGPIQLTGGYNISRFEDWCRDQGYEPPDFTSNPDLINTDPWEGLSAVWFWSVGNSTGKSLNVLADQNNIEQITKKINGGLNGYTDRIRLYVRTALVLLGFEPTDVEGAQALLQKRGLLPAGADQVDGDPGPKTRAALHMALAELSTVSKKAPVTAAPVVVKEVVDVKAPTNVGADAATGGGVVSASLGGVVQTLQEQLTPFSAAGGWISKLVVILIVVGALLTIGGLLWRWWNKRRKAEMLQGLNA